jgi:ADP-ribosylglycohydrolase
MQGNESFPNSEFPFALQTGNNVSRSEQSSVYDSDYRVDYPLDPILKLQPGQTTDEVYQQYIADELNFTRERIIALIKSRGYSNEKAEDIARNVYSSTLAELYKLYDGDQVWDEVEASRSSDYALHNTIDHFDRICTMVPIYHSLGDTMGYYNGDWEFNYGNVREGPSYVFTMISEFLELGGVLDIDLTNWQSSDDTIMYNATLKVLSKPFANPSDFGAKLRIAYLEIEDLIKGKHPGETTLNSLAILKTTSWDQIHYNSRAIGSGAIMRAGCIGLFFPGRNSREKLIRLAVECSRVTHNSAASILGSVGTALFTAFGIERLNVNRWPHEFLKLIKSTTIDSYIKETRPQDYQSFMIDKAVFVDLIQKYINFRFSGLNPKPKSDIRFTSNPEQRYKYLIENFSKGCDIPGSCAADCLIMAYDALLQCNSTFERMIVYGVLHPGDSDTVGAVGFGWFGALYHSVKNDDIIYNKIDKLEYLDQMYQLMSDSQEVIYRVFADNIFMNTAERFIDQLAPVK